MQFVGFDHETRKILRDALDGAMLILEATRSEALFPDRREQTLAILTSQLVAAAAEGQRDFEALQSKALEGIAD